MGRGETVSRAVEGGWGGVGQATVGLSSLSLLLTELGF